MTTANTASTLADVRAPAAAVTWTAALQHVCILSAYLVFPLVVMREAGASIETTGAVLALSMLTLGIATVLQGLPRLGCGFLCPVTFTAAYIAPAIYAFKLGGLHLVFGMVVFAGVVEFGLSFVLHRLRGLFPPEVAGLVILLVGFTIGSIAVRGLADAATRADSVESWVDSGLVLGVMVALAVWGRGAARTLCVLLGVLGGYAASLLLGLVSAHDAATILGAPLLAVPDLSHLGLDFDPTLIVPFAIAAMAAATKAAALAGLAQRAAGVEHDPHGAMVRGVRADGLGTVIAGLFGTIGVNPAPSSVSLVGATGLTHRGIAWAIGALLCAFAFVPPLALALATVPRAVVSGMLLFTGCLVLSNGMQMIADSRLDQRKTIVVGLGVFAALAAELNPAMAAAVPTMLAPIVASPLVLGTAVAMAANLLLRLGARR